MTDSVQESSRSAAGEDDSRVVQAVQHFLQRVEAGERPGRQWVQSVYPDLAAAMEPYLEAIEILHVAGPQLRSMAVAEDSSASMQSGPVISGPAMSGQPLGDFQLVREVGRGGMGVVYEAIQLSLGRKVALKVLPFAAALDGRQLQRFRNEAQAAAALHHPHVVPVYGVGCERGVHFYAMQLIDGQNLAALIAELRSEQNQQTAFRSISEPSAAEPHGRSLAKPHGHSLADPVTLSVLGAELMTQRSHRSTDYFRTIARLIAQASDGLQYAHSMGIIHRDVKPANILVDGSGHAWVADFGLAQVQTDQGLTRSGDLLGTLRYMSPEQAGGRVSMVDSRSDVYSLGATLYELLTLRPLFEAIDSNSLLRCITQDEPKQPRVIDAMIPVELETIALKALRKQPAERYGTAQELLDDLRRFLSDMPILARPPGPMERLSKWSRRHRAVVVSGIVALLLTVAGLSAAIWITASAYERERHRAAEAAVQYQRAEQNFRQARAAVDEFTRIGEQLAGNHPALESVRMRLLQAALVYYHDFVEQHQEDRTLQAELEASVARIETIVDELTTLAGAGRYPLLQHPAVQQELQLSESQTAGLREIDQMWRDAVRDAGRMGRSAWDQRRLELARFQEKEVRRLLSDTQRQRFQQLIWQQLGMYSLDEPVMAAALELTNGQRNQIRSLLAAEFPPGHPPHHRGQGESNEQSPLRQQQLEQILSADQLDRWQLLPGEPLPQPLFLLPPGGRGPDSDGPSRGQRGPPGPEPPPFGSGPGFGGGRPHVPERGPTLPHQSGSVNR